MALLLCLPAGLAAGFWLSRVVTQPLNSIAQAANRVALGDLGVRAQPVRQRGELAELVRDFNLMTDSLENLERERRATAAAISHELRTPLAVLRARLYAIYDDVIPGTPQELRRLLDQVEHLGRLVDDVHTLSLADAGRLSLHRSDIDLSAACAQLLSTYAGRIADHNVRAEYRTDIVPVHANADPDRINQILSNLIENALRYAASGEWLEIAVHRHDDKAVLTVTDRGPGLPEDVVAHLFERFHRTDLSRSRETGGSGLGLAIVQTLVIQQGGQVTAERPAEGGTRFRVALPAA
nr:ATP-binding protein [Pigmentiphaga litoralis]